MLIKPVSHVCVKTVSDVYVNETDRYLKYTLIKQVSFMNVIETGTLSIWH